MGSESHENRHCRHWLCGPGQRHFAGPAQRGDRGGPGAGQGGPDQRQEVPPGRPGDRGLSGPQAPPSHRHHRRGRGLPGRGLCGGLHPHQLRPGEKLL